MHSMFLSKKHQKILNCSIFHIRSLKTLLGNLLFYDHINPMWDLWTDGRRVWKKGMRKYEGIQAVYVLGYSVTCLLFSLRAGNPHAVSVHLTDISEAKTFPSICPLLPRYHLCCEFWKASKNNKMTETIMTSQRSINEMKICLLTHIQLPAK